MFKHSEKDELNISVHVAFIFQSKFTQELPLVAKNSGKSAIINRRAQERLLPENVNEQWRWGNCLAMLVSLSLFHVLALLSMFLFLEVTSTKDDLKTFFFPKLDLYPFSNLYVLPYLIITPSIQLSFLKLCYIQSIISKFQLSINYYNVYRLHQPCHLKNTDGQQKSWSKQQTVPILEDTMVWYF